MTVEETQAALDEVAAKVDGGDLSDETLNRYEELEGELQRAQKAQEIHKRHAARKSVVTPALHTGTKAKGDEELERAFQHYMRTGKENADIVELRAQSVGTDSAGGYTVPDGFRRKIVDRLKAFGGLATVAEEITTSSGEPLRWPTLDDTSNSGVIAAENTAPASGGADLVFGEVTLGAFKYVAPGATNLPLRVSYELLQDSAFDIEGLVSRKLSQRIARKQAVDWVTGAGTTEPFGIDTSSGPSNVFAGATIDKDDLISAIHAIDPEYRMNAVWVFNDATLEAIRKLEDTAGRPLWTPQAESGLEGSIGGSLLGYRVVIDQAFADYTDASSNVFGVFGDIAEGYVIRRVRDVQLVVDPYTRMNEGQVQYTMWARADGVVQNPNAFATLENDAA